MIDRIGAMATIEDILASYRRPSYADGGSTSRTNPARPFYMHSPPLMSSSDIDLYTGAAYGTPHEAYLAGQVSGRPSGRVPAAGDQGWDGYAVQVAPGAKYDDREIAASVFADSLRSPALAYGLDFSRLASVPAGQNQDLRRRINGRIHGAYVPDTDYALSVDEPRLSPGRISSHEMMHRGYTKAADDYMANVSKPADLPADIQSRDDKAALIDAWLARSARWREGIDAALPLSRMAFSTGPGSAAANSLQHRMMAQEERDWGMDRGGTAIVAPEHVRPTPTPDTAAAEALARLNRMIYELRAQRGDFSRMGPR